MHLNFFVENKDGSYDRIYEYQLERVYTIDQVSQKVKQAGFKDIKTYDEDDFGPVKADSLRILFSAVKEK